MLVRQNNWKWLSNQRISLIQDLPIQARLPSKGQPSMKQGELSTNSTDSTVLRRLENEIRRI